LDTTQTDLTLLHPFRFEEFWTFNPSCGSTISSAWINHFTGFPPFILSKKLKSTKLALKSWNSIHFGNIQKRIANTLSQLDHVHQSPPSTFSFDQEILLQNTLDNLFLQEKFLYRNKSRETWLTCNDLNMNFFHTSTIIKRRRNAIDFLKLPSGVWSSKRQEIGNRFTFHFKNVFTSFVLILDEDFLSLFDIASLLRKMLLFVKFQRNKKSSLLCQRLVLPKLQVQMDSLHFSTKNIGILSKMQFFLVFGISLRKFIY
jgi:hypothetical protein